MALDPSLDELSAARQFWKSTPPNKTGLRIGIAATFTAEPLAPYLAALLGSHGIPCRDICFAPYNQILQTCMNPRHSLGEGLDIILLLWRIEDIAPAALHDVLNGNEHKIQEIVDNATRLVQTAAEMQRRECISTIVATPPVPHSPIFDSASFSSGPLLAAAHALTLRSVDDCIATNGLVRFDLNNLISHYGIERAFDWRKWYLYRQPYTELFWWRMADNVARLIKASRSARKKCLVLDCDNTIWGGVIGEDGIEGILLGSDFPGSAFRDFQHQVATLVASGVFIALSSKNSSEDVWQVFAEHDGMVLKREHISVAQIGWHEKAEGITEIARQLNIGLDSIVFVDDSPLEIEKVRNRLPEVTCLLAPEEPAELPFLLLDSRYFDQLKITNEDRARLASFKAEEKREELRLTTSPELFRQTLNLHLKIGSIRLAHVARVAQLINKTNQFNLTTRRRSETEIMSMLKNSAYTILALDLEDRFGMYGLVGVAILKMDKNIWELDTFLLSCRALGRGVEHAFISVVANFARDKGAKKLRGFFIPTAKNSVAANFFSEVGFTAVSEGVFEASLSEIPDIDPSVTVELI